MTHFSRDTEEVLRRARLTEAMPVDKRRRLKAAVVSRIAAGGVTLLAGEAAAGVGFWATATGAVVKGVAAAALAASLGAGGYVAARRTVAKKTAVVAPVAAAAAPAALDHVLPKASARIAVPAPVVEVAPPPATRPRIIARAAERVVKAAAPVEPPPASASVAALPAPAPVTVVLDRSTLADETRILREADRALRSGNTDLAFSLLDEHANRFPDGVLAPERAAERVIAQCQAGRADAAVGARYLATHPGSPLAARVKQVCAVPR